MLTTRPRTAAARRIWNQIWRKRYGYLLVLPGLLYFLVYRYIPMLGSFIAFQDYSPFLGYGGSPWVGMKHFAKIFDDTEVVRVLWNTLSISFLQIAFAFPAPILLALMLNEVRNKYYKSIVQSIVYLPHFLSWVIVAGIFIIFLRGSGLINTFLGMYFGVGPIAKLKQPLSPRLSY